MSQAPGTLGQRCPGSLPKARPTAGLNDRGVVAQLGVNRGSVLDTRQSCGPEALRQAELGHCRDRLVTPSVTDTDGYDGYSAFRTNSGRLHCGLAGLGISGAYRNGEVRMLLARSLLRSLLD